MEVFLKYFRFAGERFLQHHTAIFYMVVIGGVLVTAKPTAFSLLLGAHFSFFGEALCIWVDGFPARHREFYVAGPYRFVRHPRQLANFLMYLGAVIAGGNFYWLWGYILSASIFFLLLIKQEESKLISVAGEKYPPYRDKVLGFFPQFLAFPNLNPKNYIFQWARVRARADMDLKLGVMVAYLLLFGLMYVPINYQWLANIILASLVCIFSALREFNHYRLGAHR